MTYWSPVNRQRGLATAGRFGPTHPRHHDQATTAPSLGSVQIPFADRKMEVTLVGAPRIVVASRATDDDLRALDWRDADIALGPLSDREFVLGWIGTVCDVQGTLTVAPERLVVTHAPRQGCDALAVGRGVVLTFAEGIDPTAITAELEDPTPLPDGG